MRNTIQKKIILNTVQNMHNHPTAEDIYEKIGAENPNISKATVYRNLNLMAEQGLIKRVKLSEGPDRYDFNTSKHYHIRCKRCGKTVDAPMDYIEGINDLLRDTCGFDTDEHIIEFIGLCPDCKLKNKNGGSKNG